MKKVAALPLPDTHCGIAAYTTCALCSFQLSVVILFEAQRFVIPNFAYLWQDQPNEVVCSNAAVLRDL
jgi:hypothetical protein